MCFAWCQKTKRSLERKEVLVNLKSVNKKWSLFKVLLSVVEIACFVYIIIMAKYTNCFLLLNWALIFIKCALLGVKRRRGV